MKTSIFKRYTIVVVVVLFLLVLIGFIFPDPVFSQDTVPIFNSDECPEPQDGYVMTDFGNVGYSGGINCSYVKVDVDNEEIKNQKSFHLAYFQSSDEALEDLKSNRLNDDYLRKFSCDAFNDCDIFERELFELTESSYMGYFNNTLMDPDMLQLEHQFVYGNFSATIFVSGQLFSDVEEVKVELEELAIVAKALADIPREMRELSSGDCGCDEPTEEPGAASEEEPQEVAAVAEEETAEEETQAKPDDLNIKDLAELITLFEADPEKLSEWPGWENLTDTQQENLIKIIDRLDDILNAESPEAVIESASTEETADPEKILLQATEIFKNEVKIASTIYDQYLITYQQFYGIEMTQEMIDEINQHLYFSQPRDPLMDMLFHVDSYDSDYHWVKQVIEESKEIEKNTPQSIAQSALRSMALSFSENMLWKLKLYKMYRGEYDRLNRHSDGKWDEEAHTNAISTLRSLISDHEIGPSAELTLYSLNMNNVPVPNIPDIED